MRRVVAELNQAVKYGNLNARAYLADMLLHGNAVGVAADFDQAKELVSEHVANPDCAGVWHSAIFMKEHSLKIMV